MKTTKKLTATERIRSTLADQIVRGEIAPGVILEESSIAERFSVSRTPVREAIRQLEAIGFVEARPHRGAVVPHFTSDKLTEMFAVMAEMEALCARWSATNITPEDSSALSLACDACRAAAQSGNLVAYYETNDEFHNAIYRASGNSFLAEVTRSVRDRVTPFRRAQFSNLGRVEASIAEHEAIRAAILAGDPDLAASRARDHLRVVRDSVGIVAPNLKTDRRGG